LQNKNSQLLRDVIISTCEELDVAVENQKRLSRTKDELENQKLGILQDIGNNGGKRLEQIDLEIRQHDRDKEVKKKGF